MRLKITLKQLERLLDQQKEQVYERLSGETYRYNSGSVEGNMLSLPIDREKMKKVAMEAKYPEDFNVLKNYIHED